MTIQQDRTAERPSLIEVVGQPLRVAVRRGRDGALAQQIAFSERHRCRRLVLVSTGTGSIMVPGSLLAGDDDPIVPVRNGRVIAGLIRNSRLHVYHGGHVDLIANPPLLAPLIEDFLAAPGPGASGGPLTRGENES